MTQTTASPVGIDVEADGTGLRRLTSEAFLRIRGDRQLGWESRAQFFSAAAEAMRRILIEYARKRGRAKRGGDRNRVPLSVLDLATAHDVQDVEDLDEAVSGLKEQDPRAAQVVELRFYAGLSVEETARALRLSERTVRREWNYARAWLYDALYRSRPEDA